MFYFLALNSFRSGNDISMLRDFSKDFLHTFRPDMAELTLCAVIK